MRLFVIQNVEVFELQKLISTSLYGHAIRTLIFCPDKLRCLYFRESGIRDSTVDYDYEAHTVKQCQIYEQRFWIFEFLNALLSLYTTNVFALPPYTLPHLQKVFYDFILVLTSDYILHLQQGVNLGGMLSWGFPPYPLGPSWHMYQVCFITLKVPYLLFSTYQAGNANVIQSLTLLVWKWVS